MLLTFLWLHLEVGGEDVLALRNQLPKVGAITFHRHLDATRINLLRPTHNLGDSPNGRDLWILQPHSEFGGLHSPSPPARQAVELAAFGEIIFLPQRREPDAKIEL